MVEWYLDTQLALLDLMYWILIAVVAFGVVGMLLEVFFGQRKD